MVLGGPGKVSFLNTSLVGVLNNFEENCTSLRCQTGVFVSFLKEKRPVGVFFQRKKRRHS